MDGTARLTSSWLASEALCDCSCSNVLFLYLERILHEKMKVADDLVTEQKRRKTNSEHRSEICDQALVQIERWGVKVRGTPSTALFSVFISETTKKAQRRAVISYDVLQVTNNSAGEETLSLHRHEQA